MATYTAYIKGHYDRQTGKGAGAYIIIANDTEKVWKAKVKKFKSWGNQHRIEFLSALSVAVSLSPSDSVVIHTNNQYVAKALSNDEVGDDVANLDYINRYKEASLGIDAKIKWVAKADNDLFAQICDGMAVAEMEQ